ncbi:MAG TPA: polyprenyl synthetase family protein [Acidimicrobiales bacterium]|nr:polyprenyl synthetase family protein [Acidimicrobiales bacterium]
MSSLAAEPFVLPPGCADIAAQVESTLRAFLGGQRAEVEARENTVGPAFDELQRVIDAGGKRLRPVFCCLGHLAGGGRLEEPILMAAAALELLHTFAVVHDDVMDRSRTRRGQPTTWTHLAEGHRRAGLRGDAERYGISTAVLVGDLAIALADQAFLGCGFPADRLLDGMERYNRMRTDMVAGQFLDVEASQRDELPEEQARRIAVLKSGVYTVEGPLHIGAVLAGGSDELLRCLTAYGVALGEAFQLRDDVLGLVGDPGVTGKDRDADLLEGKRTVLVARAMVAASPEDRAFLAGRLGHDDVTPAEVERMRSIIESSGALASTLELIEVLSGRARSALDPSLIGADVAVLLDEMGEVLAARPR